MRKTDGKRWRHIIFNTHNTWLTGDVRGFRNRGHRLHSSGDYRNPPSRQENVGIRGFHEQRSGEPIRLSHLLLEPIGQAIVENLKSQSHAFVVISVNPTHVHFLVELPDNVEQIKKIVGWCKYFTTRAARQADISLNEVNLWAEGETYRSVDSPDHYQAAKRYIASQQGADAWVWEESV